MRVLMTSSTTKGRRLLMEGDHVDLPDGVAQRLIGYGRAVPARHDLVETQMLEPVAEYAVKRRRRRKGRGNVEQN
ncbi:MAG: hypothetical protein J0H17_21405 [Rhizobiales bacterium]|nr:hypothetical protein [Hyphomicrobiales bacterium]